jgi:hypothetical protein
VNTNTQHLLFYGPKYPAFLRNKLSHPAAEKSPSPRSSVGFKRRYAEFVFATRAAVSKPVWPVGRLGWCHHFGPAKARRRPEADGHPESHKRRNELFLLRFSIRQSPNIGRSAASQKICFFPGITGV